MNFPINGQQSGYIPNNNCYHNHIHDQCCHTDACHYNAFDCYNPQPHIQYHDPYSCYDPYYPDQSSPIVQQQYINVADQQRGNILPIALGGLALGGLLGYALKKSPAPSVTNNNHNTNHVNPTLTAKADSDASAKITGGSPPTTTVIIEEEKQKQKETPKPIDPTPKPIDPTPKPIDPTPKPIDPRKDINPGDKRIVASLLNFDKHSSLTGGSGELQKASMTKILDNKVATFTDAKGKEYPDITSLYGLMDDAGMTIQDFVKANKHLFTNGTDIRPLYIANNIKNYKGKTINLYTPTHKETVNSTYTLSTNDYKGAGNSPKERALDALSKFYKNEIGNNTAPSQTVLDKLYADNEDLFKGRGKTEADYSIVKGDGIIK